MQGLPLRCSFETAEGDTGAGGGAGAGGGTDAGGGTGKGGGTDSSVLLAIKVPHDLQNLALLVLAAPHFTHLGPLASVCALRVATSSKLVPHVLQKRAFPEFSAEHFGQFTSVDFL